jgi:thiamine pyrophosphate-dependent acetolactate synthase large subunit-like protein
MRPMRGADAIAEVLRRQGVEFLFTYPDHQLIDPAAMRGIRPLMPRTERAAVAMADGYTRMQNGRRNGVVAVQYGPGIESSYGAVAQAYSDSTPILVLCGHLPRARVGQQPHFDPVENFRGIAKWTARIESATRIPTVLRRAFTYLQCGRPGPVVLDVTLEAATEDVEDRLIESYLPVRRIVTGADPADVAAAIRVLLNAARPIVHAGHGVLYADATEELREFAELLTLPVMTTLPGKSAFAEDHRLSLGAGGMSWPKVLKHFLDRADLIFGVGASLTATTFAVPLPEGRRAVQVTVDERDLNKDYPLELGLLGDAKLVLQQLIEEARRQLSGAPAWAANVPDEIESLKRESEREWLPLLTSDQVPITPYRVIRELGQATADEATVVTHDSGRPRDQIVPFWRSRSARSYLGWGKSTQLGHGLGLIMGAKLAAPERLAMNVMGDAAFGMVGLEIESAVRLQIPILTVIFNNSAMSNYDKRYPIAFERYGFKHLSGDYRGVASALGAYAERIEDPHDVGEAIRRGIEAVKRGSPAVLEFVTSEESAVSQ